jgi:carboxymethylenebutenolidase
MPDITIDVPGTGLLPAYFSPARGVDGPAPGVVVVHEAFGLTSDIRALADRFAEHGYHAVAPDLLSYGARVRCLVTVARAMSSGQGRPFTEIAAARAWLTARDDSNGRTGIAGFCLGGAFAILMANRGFDVSSVNYGRLPKRLDAAAAGACPIVASYGGRDGSLTGAAATLEAALETAGVEHDVKEYPEAGHSFLNHSEAPAWLKPMSKSLHAGFVDTAAADAWERIDRMFSVALRD